MKNNDIVAKKSPLTTKGNHVVKVSFKHLVDNYLMACGCIECCYAYMLRAYIKMFSLLYASV